MHTSNLIDPSSIFCLTSPYNSGSACEKGSKQVTLERESYSSREHKELIKDELDVDCSAPAGGCGRERERNR